jgi:signal transduction histidine kinase
VIGYNTERKKRYSTLYSGEKVMMNRLAELYIFEQAPTAERALDHRKWPGNLPLIVPVGKQVPFGFARGFLLASDVMLLSVAIVILFTTHTSMITIALTELLFVSFCLLLVVARTFQRFLPVIGAYLAIISLSIILNLVFPRTWGILGFYTLCVIVFYRFPFRWSLPFAGVCILALIATGGAVQFLPVPHLKSQGMLELNLVVGAGLCWFGWTLRSQYLLVLRLHEVQEQLREEMKRSEVLATERERTRIARDIHDVLSHSLAVLSIQVQAARHLITRDPERLAEKLDDMASLIRESITESRRVVGLLRDAPITSSGQDDLGASLRSIATTFNERTGISCRFDESGVPHKLDTRQRETLQLALREMLTNSHRHGAAKTAEITLRWREASLILAVRDDGMGANTLHTETLSRGTESTVGGHHGLQGMRERAATLGGEVEAKPAENGGFMVTLKLPYANDGERLVQKSKAI